jgi:uncharacterized protein involved in oxidation of intracellular sulfur
MATEKKEKIVYVVTCGPEDPDRASLPFMLANAAQVLEVEAVIALQGTGVFLGKKGCAENVNAPGGKPLSELIASFLAQGGKLVACVPCLKDRRIEESDLLEGIELTAAAKLTLEILSAQATMVY